MRSGMVVGGIRILVVACVLAIGASLARGAEANKQVLFLTKSAGFQHSVITRDQKDGKKMAWAEQHLIDLGSQNGFEVTVTKDADVFNKPETYRKYDIFAFYTTGDLTQASDKPHFKFGPDGKPLRLPDGKQLVSDGTLHTETPMSAEGKAMFLKSIQDGKGFIAFHCGSDTFHSKRNDEMVRPLDAKPEAVDPYIQMVGGEFKGHGSQQMATQRFVSPGFPGLENMKDFSFVEEWYNLYNLDPNIHVILVQDTTTMKVDKNGQREPNYTRAPYPATWAKMYGKGRVFYTSMGHREDVWTNPIFQQVVLAGLKFVAGETNPDLTPNMDKVAPQPTKAVK